MSDVKDFGNIRIVNFPTTATIIAVGVITLAVAIVFLLFFKEIPKENVSAVNLVGGIVLGWGGTVVAFYFGDSKKSAQQQDTINSLANPAGTAGAARLQVVAAEKQDVAADKQVKAAEADEIEKAGKALYEAEAGAGAPAWDGLGEAVKDPYRARVRADKGGK